MTTAVNGQAVANSTEAWTRAVAVDRSIISSSESPCEIDQPFSKSAQLAMDTCAAVHRIALGKEISLVRSTGYRGTVTGELIVSLTDAAVSIERHYTVSTGSFTYMGLYKRDRSESVNVNGAMTSRTHSSLKGSQLVIAGSVTTATEGSAIPSCSLIETFEIDSASQLQLVASGEKEGRTHVSRQTPDSSQGAWSPSSAQRYDLHA